MHEHRLDRQLGGGKRKSLARQRFIDAVHLVEHFARHDLGHVVLRIALAVAHAHLGGLLRYRLVRKNTNPDPPAALDVASHRPPRRLDLARGKPAAADSLQTILAETNLRADGGHTLVAALLFLAVFPSSWLQHFSLLLACERASAPPGPAPALPVARRCEAIPRL